MDYGNKKTDKEDFVTENDIEAEIEVTLAETDDFMDDLKKVYKAATFEQAEIAFNNVRVKWEGKYPTVIKSWETNWLELTTFFAYPIEIRKMIYTTNTVEGFHRQLRKVTKTKNAYPTDNALRKIIYLATIGVTEKWLNPIPSWLECKQQFEILFEERLGK